MKNKPIFFGKTLITLASLLFCSARPAEAVVFVSTIDLQNGSTTLPENPFLSYVQEPTLNSYDAYETVLKLNFAPENQIDIVKFLIEYDENPQAYTVNIGDSQTNNGHKGDAADQSNDAEMQIVNNDLTIFSNDYAPEELRVVGSISDLITENSTVSLYVKDQFLGWDEGLNTFADSNFVTSPYLYALNGQDDYEGPINYDIYAAFNRVIADSYDRHGTGVKNVTICMADESNIGICDRVKNVPEPSVLLGLLGLGILGLGSQAKSKAQKNA